MCTRLQIDNITGSIKRKAQELFAEKLVAVILYGSYARGDYDDDSDIDIMVLVDLPQQDIMSYQAIFNELSGCLSLDYDITVSIKLRDSNIISRYKDAVPFYANVINEGVAIHG